MPSSSFLQIILVTDADISRLRAISIQTFRETFAGTNTAADMEQYLEQQLSEEQLLKEWHTAGATFYFAVLDGAVAGYLKLNTGAAQTEQKIPEALEIERIYVPASFQGKGIGALLMDKALQIAREAGLNKVWLGVWEHNRKAIDFYHRYGFVAFDQHIFRLGNDEQTDILMKISLV